jgi:hypothetical protein
VDEDDREKLVEGYFRHAVSVAKREPDETFDWAFDDMADLIGRDPESACPVIVALVARATDDATLAYIAAGPLEDTLVRHGSRIIDRVAQAAQSDGRFRRALTGVWAHARLPSDVLRRIEILIEGEPRL